jgi:hypothetical protein
MIQKSHTQQTQDRVSDCFETVLPAQFNYILIRNDELVCEGEGGTENELFRWQRWCCHRERTSNNG